MSALTEPIGPRDHVLGRPNAGATLVEYGDYECPFCARAHYEVAEVLRRLGNHVRYAYRHFPLTQIHPHAFVAAQAAEAAGAEGRFWPMHTILFEHRDALGPEDLVGYAETLGLDGHRFSRDLRAGTYVPHIESDFRSAVRSGVTGTPTFFLNGLRVVRGWDADTLAAGIEEVLAQAASMPFGRPGAPPTAR